MATELKIEMFNDETKDYLAALLAGQWLDCKAPVPFSTPTPRPPQQ